MPSRPAVALILVFWLAVAGYVARRELVPRFFASAPPAIDFVLVDELSSASTRWTMYQDDRQVGTVTSRTEYVPADDSFRFSTSYRGLKFDFRVVGFEVPAANTAVRVGRDGALREQSMSGTFEATMAGVAVGSAKAEVDGRVTAGLLRGRAKLDLPVLLDRPIDEELEPVPVPAGQVMNPMMPVDRLRGVTPGRRWAVRLVDPMRDALQRLASKILERRGVGTRLFAGASAADKELMAEVDATPVTLDRADGPASCWVIRYESTDKTIAATTYVRRDDGRVLRQEASGLGERLRFERAD